MRRMRIGGAGVLLFALASLASAADAQLAVGARIHTVGLVYARSDSLGLGTKVLRATGDKGTITGGPTGAIAGWGVSWFVHYDTPPDGWSTAIYLALDTASAPPRVATVTVSLAQTTLFVGQTVLLGAQLQDSLGRTVSGAVTWTSNAPTVASVASTGLVTATGVGTAIITATAANGVRGTASVTVVLVPVTSVVVTPAVDTLTVGTAAQLVATVFDSAGHTLTGRPITWTTLTPAIVSVTPGGLVGALTAGTGQVQASAGTVTTTATIVVAAAIVAGRFAPALLIAPNMNFAVPVPGAVVQYQALFQDSTGAVQWVTSTGVVWRSSDTTVGRINGIGYAKFVGPGTDTISATFNGVRSGPSVVTVPASQFVSVAAVQFLNLPSHRVVDWNVLVPSAIVTGLPVATGGYDLNFIGPARDTVARARGCLVTGP